MSKTLEELFNFAFNISQEVEEKEAFVEDVAHVFEQMDNIDKFAPAKTELKSALKELGVDVAEDTLSLCQDTFAIVTDCPHAYAALKELVLSPEKQEALAEKGWVAYAMDDQSSTTEEPSFKVKFLELAPPAESTGADDFSDEALDKMLGDARKENGFEGEAHVSDPVASAPHVKESAESLVASLLEGKKLSQDDKDEKRVMKIKRKTEKKLARRFGESDEDYGKRCLTENK